ncbi:MAG: hypothetical protein AB1589_22825 [Cyanobacteriota bacterium]
MTNQVYTRPQLESKKLADLKAIASQLSATPAGDKRVAANWVEAILEAQPKSVKSPKPLLEVNGNDCTVNGEVIATITSDDDLTQPWIVKINNIEVHRAATWAKCHNFVRWHYKQGTLPSPQDVPQPTTLATVGDSHFIGSTLLRCVEVGGEYAVVWRVYGEGLFDKIQMRWDCFWQVNGEGLYLTPQEAVASLKKAAQGGDLLRQLARTS